MEKLLKELQQAALQRETRRHFFQTCSTGLGAMALGSFLSSCGWGGNKATPASGLAGPTEPMMPRPAQFNPKAKRVIYIHMAGSPSQLELFDYKPELVKYHGRDCPQELLEGKKFAFIRGVPKMLGPQGKFAQYGQSGAWLSDYLPHLQGVVDEISFLKAMHTDQFNHAPAQLLMHTGSARLGRPSIGSWVTYGLGSENDDLPGFVVLASGGKQPDAGKSVWGSGFLPTVYQGVQCRTDGDPVLYVSDPAGMNRDIRKQTIDAITEINQQAYNEVNDPEILTRISQYELAFRMQMSVPDAMDIKSEPQYIMDLYGADPNVGSFARNCLLARRLVERGVRFVQLFDWGWDTHGTSADGALEIGLKNKCRESDQAVAGLLKDLKQRGLLDDTLVVWGGEFGRTPMQENRDGLTLPFMGRDHHLDAFTVWMAGGGVRKGFSYGETDDIGYYGVKDKVHVHDLHATILHLLGFDHEQLTYPFQGRSFRLTDVAGKVVKPVLA
ncbi:DUF1501 domain-containing protein [Rudanella paleaurantiibacter]|uniref:DUF1501 domain-containing protein n=1 Tax=Rudanella paleaurantiibacter TaxID=2614655 RepID=A0A7J5TYS4_9BACT|nr:DUF1501 domain-containing protein [Rudanella paleaurantiibacter]KAB7729056.1 DUF1501 domain-containing protein [Rudanella paleaurantiibacter]